MNLYLIGTYMQICSTYTACMAGTYLSELTSTVNAPYI